MSKKYAERKDTIKSVRLVIDAYDGRELEIPLEIWQVDVIREMLGLSVDTTNLDTYCMRSKEQTNETNYTVLQEIPSRRDRLGLCRRQFYNSNDCQE